MDDCIKYANDILPEIQLPEVLDVQAELRLYRLKQPKSERLEDVLQLYQTLWYAWSNLSNRYRSLSSREEKPSNFLTGPSVSSRFDVLVEVSISRIYHHLVAVFDHDC